MVRQHLAHQHTRPGVKCWTPPPPNRPAGSAPLGTTPGFTCRGVWCGCGWPGLGGNLPSKLCCHPAPACAPLRHCPTKSSAAVIAGKKKPHTPQAVRAPSSSAGNDCWVKDLHWDNFELLSALKPCSLLCAADEMCWLLRPGSCFLLLSLAGEGQRGSAPSLNDPCAQRTPRKMCWGELPALMAPQFLFSQCSRWHPAWCDSQ